jgi:hypothetical protein
MVGLRVDGENFRSLEPRKNVDPNRNSSLPSSRQFCEPRLRDEAGAARIAALTHLEELDDT